MGSGWFLDTKFIAAVEKSLWSTDQRWGYTIVGLNTNEDTISRLQTKPPRRTPPRPPTINLAGVDIT